MGAGLFGVEHTPRQILGRAIIILVIVILQGKREKERERERDEKRESERAVKKEEMSPQNTDKLAGALGCCEYGGRVSDPGTFPTHTSGG